MNKTANAVKHPPLPTSDTQSSSLLPLRAPGRIRFLRLWSRRSVVQHADGRAPWLSYRDIASVSIRRPDDPIPIGPSPGAAQSTRAAFVGPDSATRSLQVPCPTRPRQARSATGQKKVAEEHSERSLLVVARGTRWRPERRAPEQRRSTAPPVDVRHGTLVRVFPNVTSGLTAYVKESGRVPGGVPRLS